MSQKMIYETIGIPDKIRHDEDNSDSIYLEYNKDKLRLTIYKNENNRLGYFQTSNSELIYNNLKIIGSEIDWVKKEIFGELIHKWDVDHYDFFSTHGDNENWITLNVEYGRVISLELGVPWKNENEYDWPNKLQIN